MKEFKLTEKNAKVGDETQDIEWEGAQAQVESETKLNADKGIGQAVVLRTFTFAANKESFQRHLPTAQELFNSHSKGIDTMLWKDGLKHFMEVEPRLIFSKDKSHYRFIVACIPALGNTLIDTPHTLTELLNDSRSNTNQLSGKL